MSHKRLFLLLFIVVSILPIIGFFHQGLPVTDDGKDQVARIANFYTDLQYESIIPRWAENLNWGYGHPILMFLYPLPSYIASLFHFLGFSFIDSTKLVFVLAFIASGLSMFLWLSEILPYEPAIAGSLIYLIAPYRFIDLYVRGDIGECLAIIFPPLIFYFLVKLSKKPLGWHYGGLTISVAGLILAHNAVALMIIPLVLLYAFYLYWQIGCSNRFLFSSALFITLGFGLAAFFWIPALLEGKYTLRSIVIKGDIEDNFVTLQRLIYGSWGYGIDSQFTLQVGILQWLSVLSSVPVIFLFYKKKMKEWVFLCVSLGIFIITIFMMLKISDPIWQHISIIQNFQFPWRLLILSVFLSSILGAFSFSILPKKIWTGLLIAVFILIVFFNAGDWHAQSYLIKPDSFFSGIYNGTTDTGESAPVWSVRFMEHRPDKSMDVISGMASIRQLKRTPTMHIYTIKADGVAQVVENTLYFPNWKVLIDGNPTEIQYQDPLHRGLMTFFVPTGTHNVEVIFTQTRLRQLAEIISVISAMLLIAGIVFKKRIWQI